MDKNDVVSVGGFILILAVIYACYCIYSIIKHYSHKNEFPNATTSLSFDSGIHILTLKMACITVQVVAFACSNFFSALKHQPIYFALIATTVISIYEYVLYFKDHNTLPPKINAYVTTSFRPSYVNCAHMVRAEIDFLINTEYKRNYKELDLSDEYSVFTDLLYYTDIYLLKTLNEKRVLDVDMCYYNAYTSLNTIIINAIECGYLNYSDGSFNYNSDLLKILRYNAKKLGASEEEIKELDKALDEGIKAVGEKMKERYDNDSELYLNKINHIEPVEETIVIGRFRYYH